MKWLYLPHVFTVGCLLATGAPTDAQPTSAPPAPPKLVEVRRSAAGDSLLYKFSWGAGSGATGYRVHVYSIPFSATVPASSGWTTLPATNPRATVGLEMSTWLINPVWDSVRFRVVVRSTRATGNTVQVSRDSSFAEWKVVRLQGPGPVIVDSSAVIIGLIVAKQPLPGEPNASALCPVFTFHDGKQGMARRYSGGPCASVRGQILDVLTSAQQLAADSMAVSVRSSAADALTSYVQVTDQ